LWGAPIVTQSLAIAPDRDEDHVKALLALAR
jgi:hypothetical protein